MPRRKNDPNQITVDRVFEAAFQGDIKTWGLLRDNQLFLHVHDLSDIQGKAKRIIERLLEDRAESVARLAKRVGLLAVIGPPMDGDPINHEQVIDRRGRVGVYLRDFGDGSAVTIYGATQHMDTLDEANQMGMQSPPEMQPTPTPEQLATRQALYDTTRRLVREQLNLDA